MPIAVRALIAALLAGISLLAVSAPPPITLRSVASGLSAPLAVTNAGDGSGRLFIFTVTLSAPVGTGVSLGTPATATVTINDDEASLNFASATYAVMESGPNSTVAVNRSGAVTSAVSVTWTTGNGTAIAGQDFGTTGNPAQLAGTLSWSAGDATTKSISLGRVLAIVPILDDTLLEGDETFTITLSAPTGGAALGPTSQTTVTITYNESTFDFAPPTATVSEVAPNTFGRTLEQYLQEPDSKGCNSPIAARSVLTSIREPPWVRKPRGPELFGVNK